MATFTISSDSDFDDATVGGVDGDLITINSGATCTINQTPKFLINSINMVTGNLHINGAGATRPISIPLTGSITSSQLDSRLKISEGWWNVGTTIGASAQIINFNDYWKKVNTGGSRRGDIVGYLKGVKAQTGKKFRWSGGTGTLPSIWDYVYSVNLNDTFGTEAYYNYAPIMNVGTAPGDPTSGTFDVKYQIGRFDNLNRIEVRKVDNTINGPQYRDTWVGTMSAKATEPTEYYTTFVNAAYNGTDTCYDLNLLTTSPTSVSPLAFRFIMQSGSTSGTFGGSNCYISPYNMKILAPMVNITYATAASDLNGGTGVNPNKIPTNPQLFLSAGGNISLNGVNVSGHRILKTNPTTFDATGLFCSELAITSCLATSVFKECVISDLQQSNMSYSGVTNAQSDVLFDDCYFTRTKITGLQNWFADSCYTIRSNNCRYLTIPGGSLNGAAQTSYVRDLIYTNPMAVGINSANGLNSLTVSNYKFLSQAAGGTSVNPTSRQALYMTAFSGTLRVTGIEMLNGSINPGTSLIYMPNAYSQSAKIRCIGSSKYPAHLAYFTNILNLTATQISNLEVARVFTYGVGLTLPPTLFSIGSLDSNVHIIDVSVPSGINLPSRDSYIEQGCISTSATYAIQPGGKMVDTAYTNVGKPWHSYYEGEGDHIAGMPNNGGIYLGFRGPSEANPAPFTATSGSLPVRISATSWTIKANSVLESSMDFFAKGITGFTGVLTRGQGVTNTTRGANAWLGGATTVEFQYDIGSGWNGSWVSAASLSSVVVDPSIGVKLKCRITASATDTTAAYALEVQTITVPYIDRDKYLVPIDQTTTTIVLQNMVIGSRYWVYNNTGGSLIASGVAASSSVTIQQANLADGTTLKIRVRYASSTTKYIPFETLAITSSYFASIYVSQTIDTIAS